MPAEVSGPSPGRPSGGQAEAAPPARAARPAPPLYLRLAILIGAVLLPALIYSIVSAYSAYRENQARSEAAITRFGQLAASRTQMLMDSTHNLLKALATGEFANGAAEASCAARMKDLADAFDEYRNFAVVDENGAVTCSSIPIAAGFSVADRPWFQQARATNDQVVSQLVISKLQKQPVVVVAMPLAAKGDPFRGVVSVGINALWLAGIAGSSDLPAQSVAFLVDREGRAITRSGQLVDAAAAPGAAPDPELAALPGLTSLHEALAGNATQIFGTGSDGVARIYSFTRIARSELFVVLALPRSGPIGWARREFLHQMFAALALLLCGLIGVAVGGDLLIARNIRALSATALALQRGDYAARPAIAGASREVRQLADALVGMAEQVQRHEQDMKRSVQQKEAMLKEIHHRVKNNLQVVTSLMSIQANRLSDEASKRALAELQRRVRALGLLHRHLYEGDDLRYLDFGQFTVELCQMVRDSSGPAARGVDIKVDIPPIPITADRAVPLGLLITEALGNALKHGFANGRAGIITINLSATAEGLATVTITDNGIGPPPDEGAQDRHDPGTGMLLMHAFAQQLGSTLSVEGPPGTTIRFNFDLTGPDGAPSA